MSTKTSYRDRSRAPSFVDLRRFADEALPELRALSPDPMGNAFLACRTALWALGAPSTVGMMRLDGAGTVLAMPDNEFVIVISGKLRLEGSDVSLALAPGDAAYVIQGAGFTWRTEGEAAVAYLRVPGDEGQRGTLIPFSEAPTMAASAAPSAALLLGPAPICRTHLDYQSENGVFKFGTFDSTPCRRRGFRYPHHEIMHILEGEVTLTDEFGHAETFAGGDIILAEFAANCAWDSPNKVTKTFAISRLAPMAS